MNFNELGDTEGTEHTPQERAAAASRSTWVSVVVNLVLSTVQIVVGVLSKSQGLIADGIHSLSDLVADFVVLFANHHSQKDADEDHPYGHQRFETAASLVPGLLLLRAVGVGVGVGMVWSAVLKLENPDTVPQVHAVALWVAGGALLGKELLFRYMLAVAKRVKSNMLVANAWHARSDRCLIARGGRGHCGQPGGQPHPGPDCRADCGLHGGQDGLGGWLGRHARMDRAVDEQEVQAIRQTLLDTPGVAGVRDVRTRKMGDMVVDARIAVEEGTPLRWRPASAQCSATACLRMSCITPCGP